MITNPEDAILLVQKNTEEQKPQVPENNWPQKGPHMECEDLRRLFRLG